MFPNGIPSTESEVKKYLTTIDVPITKKDGTKTTTKLTLHKDFANDVKKVFQIAQDNGFKIYDAYCYSWRNVAGSSTKSAHSYGLACDINPKENYCYCISSFSTCTIKNPTTGKTDLCYDGWWKPGIDEYSMAEDSSIVRAFYSIGWGWGGNWKSKKDYMHFSYTNN